MSHAFGHGDLQQGKRVGDDVFRSGAQCNARLANAVLGVLYAAGIVEFVVAVGQLSDVARDARRVIAFGRGNDFAGKVCDMTDQLDVYKRQVQMLFR